MASRNVVPVASKTSGEHNAAMVRMLAARRLHEPRVQRYSRKLHNMHQSCSRRLSSLRGVRGNEPVLNLPSSAPRPAFCVPPQDGRWDPAVVCELLRHTSPPIGFLNGGQRDRLVAAARCRSFGDPIILYGRSENFSVAP
ncbi:hypothetical protein VTO73DRAFT_9256 [Trametes versicolor]